MDREQLIKLAAREVFEMGYPNMGTQQHLNDHDIDWKKLRCPKCFRVFGNLKSSHYCLSEQKGAE